MSAENIPKDMDTMSVASDFSVITDVSMNLNSRNFVLILLC